MNCVVNKMYPEIKVESKNLEYAKILLQDYAGIDSELTAITLYSYQHFSKFKNDEEYAHIIEQISITEMVHLSLLGETINLLGMNPVYGVYSTEDKFIPWNGNNVKYSDNIIDILNINIVSEKKAIYNYKKHRDIIDDKYIKELINRIIEDEEKHIECFDILLNKYKAQ